MPPVAWLNQNYHHSGLVTMVIPSTMDDDEYDHNASLESSFEVVHIDHKPTPEHRHVWFSEEANHVHRVLPNRRDIPTVSKREMWYNSSELKKLRQNEQKTLRRVADGEQMDEIDRATIAPQLYSLERMLQKLTAQALVLEQQSRTRTADGSTECPSHSLAYQYKDFCSRCSHATFMAKLVLDNNLKGKHKAFDILPIVSE